MTRTMAGIGWMALVCSLAYGQGPEPRLEFEVASVKPAAPQENGRMMIGSRGGPGSSDPGRVTYINNSLLNLLGRAYDVKPNQISGTPSWLDSERFDISAKVPEGATKEQVKVMLQNLLADRFKLAIHREKKEMSMYALVVAKNGPKLKESASLDEAAIAAPNSGEPRPADGNAPPLPPPMRMAMGKDGCPDIPVSAAGRPTNFMMMSPYGACIVATHQTMSGLADMLNNQFDRPVVDMTGIQGKYDIKVRYDPSTEGRGMGPFMMAGPPPKGAAGGDAGPGPGDGGRGPAADADPPPSIFAALQEQLGLKLEPRKGPVDLLVIDHIEKTPTEN